jgi:hypothetical protein
MAYRPIARQRPRIKQTTAIAMQQLRKYATILEPLLANGPLATMEVSLEVVFSMWSPLRLYYLTNRV